MSLEAITNEMINEIDDPSAKKSSTKRTRILWSDEMIEALIEAYQGHDCLWNMCISAYKDQNKKGLALEKIDEVMGEFDVCRVEFTSKWNNLRAQFLRDYNKIQKSKTSGSGTSEVWQSSWKWYPRLEFLKTGEELLDGSTDTSDFQIETGDEYPKPRKGKKGDISSKRMELLEKSIDFLNQGDRSDTREMDEDEAFGKMIVETLRRFSPYQKMFAKKKINDALFDIEYSTFQQQQQMPAYGTPTFTRHARSQQQTSSYQPSITSTPVSSSHPDHLDYSYDRTPFLSSQLS